MRFQMIFVSTLLLGATAIFGCKSSSVATKKTAPQPPITVFKDMKLIDGSGTLPIEPAVMVVQSGKILRVGPAETIQVPEDATVVSLQGKTIIPGLISNHTHVGLVDGMNVSLKNYTRENIQKQLKQYEKYGVTTIAALGLNADLFYDLRKASHEGSLQGAELFGADRGMGPVQGAPPVPKEFTGPALTRVKNAKEGRRAVKEAKERGAEFIKIWLDDFLKTLPKMKPAVYKAIIEEAHKQSLPVAVHVYYLDDAKKVVKAGADILAHGIRSGKVDASFIQRMKEQATAYVPTLGVDESFYVYGEHPEWVKDEFFRKALSPALREQIENAGKMTALLSNPTTDLHRRAVKTSQENLKTLFEGGVLIGFGTDSGANPWRIPGFAEHRELELMVQAGLTPLQALQIATANAAKVLRLEDRGVLVAEKNADFIILAKDPSENILNTRTIEAVWHRGERVSSGPL